MKSKKIKDTTSSKKVAKPKTRNPQDLLNARPELGPKFVFTNPRISQIKLKSDK